MWIPLRAPKMYGFIFGFQRLVWFPECTPASSNCFMDTSLINYSPLVLPPPSSPSQRTLPGTSPRIGRGVNFCNKTTAASHQSLDSGRKRNNNYNDRKNKD